MDFKQLTYFITIVEEGTISAAAKKLHMSQPPLSYQMKMLEEELHCTLFERGPRRIYLTDEGTQLYAKAQNLVNLSESIKDEMIAMSSSEQGTIHIGIVSSVISSYGIRWIGAFAKQHPNIHLEIFESNTYDLLNKLKENVIQLAILRTPYNDESLAEMELFRESLVAIESSANPQIPTPSVTLEELIHVPLVTYHRWRKVLNEQFAAKGLSVHYRCVCDDARTAASLVEEQVGVGIVPLSTAQSMNPDTLRYHPIKDLRVSSEIRLVYHRNTYIPNCCRTFLAFMESQQSQKEKME